MSINSDATLGGSNVISFTPPHAVLNLDVDEIAAITSESCDPGPDSGTLTNDAGLIALERKMEAADKAYGAAALALDKAEGAKPAELMKPVVIDRRWWCYSEAEIRQHASPQNLGAILTKFRANQAAYLEARREATCLHEFNCTRSTIA